MKAWLKKSWGWIVAIAVFAVAVLVWVATRQRSPWAAQKILEIQGDAEVQIQKVEEKSRAKIDRHDSKWAKKREKLAKEARHKMSKIKAEGERLSAAALLKKAIEEANAPL